MDDDLESLMTPEQYALMLHDKQIGRLKKELRECSAEIQALRRIINLHIEYHESER